MKSPAAIKAMKDFLLRLPESVREQLTTKTPKEVGCDYLLHISRNKKIKTFVPRVSDFLAGKEDRSIPRICTATTLFGCFVAYQRELRDFMERSVNPESDFLGGWAVYGIPFDLALQPTAKLLIDVNESDEHWLVAYSRQVVDYPAEIKAKVFFGSVTQVGTKNGVEQHVSMYLDVRAPEGLQFDGKVHLPQGYWLLQAQHNARGRSWSDCRGKPRVQSITRDEYYGAKKIAADLLSYEETPPSARW